MASQVRTFAAAMAAAALAAVTLAVPAHAGTFSAIELTQDNALLNQFNLVSIGNLTQSTPGVAIQGRALVGGSATLSSMSTVCTVNCAGNTTSAVDGSGATYGALTVFGNLTAPTTDASGAVTYSSVAAGDANVKGTLAGNLVLNTASSSGTGKLNIVGTATNGNIVNANAVRTTQSSFAGGNYTASTTTGQVTGYGPTPQVNQTLASVFPFGTTYQTNATNLAQGIANLPGTPGVHPQALPSGNAVFFTANADYTAANGLTYGVVTTTLANLASETNFAGVNNNGNAATFVIVTGDGANYTLPNLNSYTGASSVIFDFVNATTLKFAGNWNGTILAPLATITQQGGSINGSVVVASIAQSNALNDGSNFAGNLGGLAGLSTSVPEPASLVLLGAGLVAAGVLRRRRA